MLFQPINVTHYIIPFPSYFRRINQFYLFQLLIDFITISLPFPMFLTIPTLFLCEIKLIIVNQIKIKLRYNRHRNRRIDQYLYQSDSYPAPRQQFPLV